MKRRVSKIWIIVMVFAAVNLACGLPKFGSDEEGSLPEESGIQLGEEYRSEEGGFSFKVIPGYKVEEFFGLVSMEAPGADPDTGPSLLLIGGTNEESKTLDQLVDDFKAGLEPGDEIIDQRDISIDGNSGVALDLKGTANEKELAGRIIIMALTPTRVFNMMAVAPPDRWEDEIESFLEAVVATIRFFEPVVSDETGPSAEILPEESAPAEAVVFGEIVRQWAATAKAGSEYDNPGWAAHQATGEPDTYECGDYNTAWASYDQFAIEWLEVGYASPVIPLQVNIYESHTPSQIVKVELLDNAGAYHEIYTATPALTDCPFTLSILVEGATYQAVAVKITVDQSKLGVPWDEIDAVQLVGYGVDAAAGEPVAEEPAVPEPTAAVPAPTQGTTLQDGELSSWKWTTYTTTEGLSDNNTRSIAVAPDGTVWVGTFGAGVSSLKNGSFTNYSTDHGLGHKQVMAIAVAPDGTVWAGTILGLSRFDGST
ncbi:MAG: hypothetical protein MUO76_01525, partial [Anaerolineaceae bacterium]|nr:hypothetical protein [Anaerolineaceae bacterium]